MSKFKFVNYFRPFLGLNFLLDDIEKQNSNFDQLSNMIERN